MANEKCKVQNVKRPTKCRRIRVKPAMVSPGRRPHGPHHQPRREHWQSQWHPVPGDQWALSAISPLKNSVFLGGERKN
jgi:hypothetical protein